jgi:UDP-N-acetylglucosamine transferase subunit ALG13
LFGCRIVYLECGGRVDRLSLTCRLLAPIVDRLYVQWPELQERHRRARYVGRVSLRNQSVLLGDHSADPPDATAGVFVTVGSTRTFPFDRLVDAAEAISRTMAMRVQFGCADRRGETPGFVAFLQFDELVREIRQASVVVSHGGIGSVMLALALDKKPVIVPRRPELREVVDTHQIDFARRLEELGLAVVVTDTAHLAGAIEGVRDNLPLPPAPFDDALPMELAEALSVH